MLYLFLSDELRDIISPKKPAKNSCVPIIIAVIDRKK